MKAEIAFPSKKSITARMRRLEADHQPDGWPAIRMRDITALCDEIEQLRDALARVRPWFSPETMMGRGMIKTVDDALRDEEE